MIKLGESWIEKHYGFKPMLRSENGKFGFFPLIVTDYEKFAKYLLFFFFYWLVISVAGLFIMENKNA
jgi:hypothetical protein